jgi:hypothetical protein
MPEEVLAMVIVMSFLTFVFTVIRSTQHYKLKKMEQQSLGSSEDSLTTSELREMIEQAVEESNARLRDDVKALSARLDEIEPGSTLDIGLQSAPAEKTVGRPSRQRQR